MRKINAGPVTVTIAGVNVVMFRDISTPKKKKALVSEIIMANPGVPFTIQKGYKVA